MLDFYINKSNNLTEAISFIANILVTLIAIYTAWLRFFRKRIDILSISIHHSTFYGKSLSLVIENKTLSNYTVSSIDFIYNNQYITQICKYDEPFVIEPLKAYKISMEPITMSEPSFSELTSGDILNSNNKFSLNTSKGEIILTKNKQKNFDDSKLVKTRIHRNRFNGKVLSDGIEYVLSILCESGNYKDILIDKSGLMSDDLFGFNALPNEIMVDFESLINHFKQEGEEKGLTFTLYQVGKYSENKYYSFRCKKIKDNYDGN